MIARFWRGWATTENVTLYRRHFHDTVRPHIEALPGFRACFLLEKRENGEVELLAITHWQSLEAIKAFAGNDVSVAKVEPQARAVLSRFETTATHYDIVEA
jgi:heme-degrading monooxygenase HmoA